MFGRFPFGFDQDDDHMSSETSQKKEIDNTKFYTILGVEKNATSDEIKKSFRQKTVQGEYRHPDKGGDPDKFKQLNEAYAVLSDPKKKQLYDKFGEDLGGNGGGHSHDPQDIMSMFFGGGRQQQEESRFKKNKPKLKEVDVTLEDVYNGKVIQFQHSRKRTCVACDGKGGKNVKQCTTCKGRKIVEKMVMLGPGMYSSSRQYCSDCQGQGEQLTEKDKCKSCTGQKIVDNDTTLDVQIEPGVPNDHDNVLTGESDEGPGVLAGDLVVRIKIKPHNVFKRKGADLWMDKQITLLESLSGFNFELTHLDGKKVNIGSNPNETVAHNQVKVVKSKGMPFYKDSFGYGNLYIQFSVVFPPPQSLTGQQLEELKKILQGPKQKEVDKNGKFEYLDEYVKADMNPNPEGGQQVGGEEEETQQERVCVQQ